MKPGEHLSLSFFFFASVLFFFSTAATSGQTLEDVIQRNLEAHGGAVRLRARESIKVTGRVIFSNGAGEGTFSTYKKKPNRVRIDVSFGGDVLSQASDGIKTWQRIPVFAGGSGEVEAMPPDQASSFQTQADFGGPLLDYRKKEHKIELLGKEPLNGKEMVHLRIQLHSGQLVEYYLDSETYLESVIVSREHNAQLGIEVEQRQLLGDYRAVDGIQIAHSIETRIQDQTVLEFQVESVEWNPSIDDSFFSADTAKVPVQP